MIRLHGGRVFEEISPYRPHAQYLRQQDTVVWEAWRFEVQQRSSLLEMKEGTRGMARSERPVAVGQETYLLCLLP